MELKELGKTGVMVPEIGLGTWKYHGGVAPLRRGIELGARFIDTAEMYRTEDVVGQVLDGLRDSVFLATKVSGSHLHRGQIIPAVEASLRLLAVDQIDLYQVHWPDQGVPIGETMAAMEALANQGTVRYIGVSNFDVRELREAQRAMANHPIVSNQVLYSLKDREIERDLLPYCQEQSINIIAYTPLADGSLANKPRFTGKRNKGLATLQEVASEVGKTMAQVSLNWCTSHDGVIAIPKTNSLARTEENCGASDWRLSPDQLSRLDSAFPA